LQLSLQACVQDISGFLAGQALAFQQCFRQFFDHAPGIVNKIPCSCLQVFKRVTALPFFPVQATQQVCHNFGIAGGLVVSDELSIETPLCFLSGKRANNPVMVAPNASSC
jgi:hypothetical protein